LKQNSPPLLTKKKKMQKQIEIGDKKVSYTLKTSKRARRMRMAVYCDGSLVVTRPWGLSENAVKRFIMVKSGWVLPKLDRFKGFKGTIFKDSREKYLKNKDKALEFISGRVEHFNEIYGFKFNKINIRNQKTRWGSCSRKGNLNFNYKLLFLPAQIADYIIVHELCHLKEFNHSKRFWDLVAEIMPEYLKVRKELKGSRLNLFLN